MVPTNTTLPKPCFAWTAFGRISCASASRSAAFDAYAPGLHHLCLRVDRVEDVREVADRLRALGVTSLKRSGALPDVPTLDEAGVPGFESTAWWGLLAPAKTPKPILDKLYNVTIATMKTPEIRARLDQLGAEPAGHTPEAFDQLIRDDINKWGKVVKALGITAD